MIPGVDLSWPSIAETQEPQLREAFKCISEISEHVRLVPGSRHAVYLQDDCIGFRSLYRLRIKAHVFDFLRV